MIVGAIGTTTMTASTTPPQREEINNNVTLSIVLLSNCTLHTTSLREQRKLAIAREEVVTITHQCMDG